MNYGGSLLYKFGKFLPVKDRPFITFELSAMTGTVSPQQRSTCGQLGLGVAGYYCLELK